MKRPLENQDTDDVDDSGSQDSDSESESITEMSRDGSKSLREQLGRSLKSKERNRMHSKLTRMRRVSRINQMKERLLELQTEVGCLSNLLGFSELFLILWFVNFLIYLDDSFGAAF